MTCGIYILYYETDDFQYYIGKSLNIESRFRQHCTKLKSGVHINKNLTYRYNLYNMLPVVSILEELPYDNKILYSREAHWISLYDSFYNGMNETPGGTGTGFGEDSPNSKYLNSLIESIFLTIIDNPTKCLAEIANQYKVPIGVVSQITTGVNHSWLSKIYPNEYTFLLSLVGTRSKVGFKGISAKDKGIVYPKIQNLAGEIYNVENTNQFAKLHGLSQGCLHMVLTGKRNMHKGWKLYKGNIS